MRYKWLKYLSIFMTTCFYELKQIRLQFLENLFQKASNICSVQRMKAIMLRPTALMAHYAWDPIATFSQIKTDLQILLWNEHT